jgi:hypothetical protein
MSRAVSRVNLRPLCSVVCKFLPHAQTANM